MTANGSAGKTLLYKYRSLAGEERYYTSRILAHNRVYYASPKDFNDPFDCRFRTEWKGTPFEGFSDAEISEKLKEGGLSKSDASKERVFEKLHETISVLALSKRPDITPMWSHYADKHRGICLGFSLERDRRLEKVNYDNTPATLHAVDVIPLPIVPNRRLAVLAARNRLSESVHRIVTTKAPCWRYEEEWRFITNEKSHEGRLPPKTIVKVIFGAKTSEADKEVVRDWVSIGDHSVSFFQAFMKDDTFDLHIRPVD